MFEWTGWYEHGEAFLEVIKHDSLVCIWRVGISEPKLVTAIPYDQDGRLFMSPFMSRIVGRSVLLSRLLGLWRFICLPGLWGGWGEGGRQDRLFWGGREKKN